MKSGSTDKYEIKRLKIVKSIIHNTRHWTIRHWKVFRNVYWKTYSKERNSSLDFKTRKLAKIKEFNKVYKG